jgi:carbon monoxide dehydrogenase subunit G
VKVGNIDVILDFTDVKDALKAYERGADGRDIVEFFKTNRKTKLANQNKTALITMMVDANMVLVGEE